MDKEIRISQVLGLLDSTLGSPRGYTVRDYRRRMEMSAALLRDDEATYKKLGAEDAERQAVLDADREEKFRIEAVRNALSEISTLYGFSGESGTEELFHLLDNAMISTDGDVRVGHEDGLFTDCLTSLARHLDEEYVLVHGAVK